MEPISKFVAWQLCAQIWKENHLKWYTSEGRRCRNCYQMSQASPANRLVSRQADYRGCPLVNDRYDNRKLGKHDPAFV